MASDWQLVRDTTLQTRAMIRKVLESLKGSESTMPANWNNNAHWQAGHLVLTPRLLTLSLMGKDIGYSEEFKNWFRKDTGPNSWSDASKVTSYDEILPLIESDIEALFDQLKDCWEQPYPESYTTSVGVVLDKPSSALNFSQFHDGIHLGSLLALRRALKS